MPLFKFKVTYKIIIAFFKEMFFSFRFHKFQTVMTTFNLLY